MNIVWWSNNVWDNVLSYVLAPILIFSVIYAGYSWIKIVRSYISKKRKDKDE
jgi:hypothetical protein